MNKKERILIAISLFSALAAMWATGIAALHYAVFS